MIKLGITGGIGSGKSTVSNLLSLYQIPLYNADIESKKLTNQSEAIRQKLIVLFGQELYSNGILNKQMLAELIFSNKQNLEKVNAIIHPEVFNDFQEWAKQHAHCPIIAAESAIMFESGMNQIVDKVITVFTPLEIRIERVMKRDNLSRKKVLDRINNQMPEEEKAHLSDYVIYNEEQQSLIEQVEQLLSNVKYINA